MNKINNCKYDDRHKVSNTLKKSPEIILPNELPNSKNNNVIITIIGPTG